MLRMDLKFTHPCIHWVPIAHFQWVRWLEYRNGNSPPSNTEVKNPYSFTSRPSPSSSRHQVSIQGKLIILTYIVTDLIRLNTKCWAISHKCNNTALLSTLQIPLSIITHAQRQFLLHLIFHCNATAPALLTSSFLFSVVSELNWKLPYYFNSSKH
jgi:hypothetical protein